MYGAVDPTVTSTITDATAGLSTQLLTVAAVGLGIGVTIFALKRGVGLAYGFIKKN